MDLVRMPIPPSFVHGDTQASNIMVDADTLAYRALIDWGSCGWGDPALDFAGMPLRAVPDVLVGYRDLVMMPDDETAEARILLAHLHIALLNLCRDPQPLRSWAERPAGYLLDIMRFLLEDSSGRWRELRPLWSIDNVAWS
jgi:Ser/Thr protein kinase RdoA (MazF antagonist)